MVKKDCCDPLACPPKAILHVKRIILRSMSEGIKPSDMDNFPEGFVPGALDILHLRLQNWLRKSTSVLPPVTLFVPCSKNVRILVQLPIVWQAEGYHALIFDPGRGRRSGLFPQVLPHISKEFAATYGAPLEFKVVVAVPPPVKFKGQPCDLIVFEDSGAVDNIKPLTFDGVIGASKRDITFCKHAAVQCDHCSRSDEVHQ